MGTDTDEPSGSITLADGRSIAYTDGGEAAGYPVVGLHGTPGCRLNRGFDLTDIAVRLSDRAVRSVDQSSDSFSQSFSAASLSAITSSSSAVRVPILA